MNVKMDEMNNKLDTRIAVLEGRVFDIEQSQKANKTDIETTKQKVQLTEEMTHNVEYTANLAITQADRQEQYLRNYNIRIFNVPENTNETIGECERKVLALFEEKLQIKVSLESIDNLHRIGPKHSGSTSTHLNKNNETDTTNNNENKNENRDKQDTEENKREEDSDMNIDENQERDTLANKQDLNSNAKVVGRPIIVSFVSRRIRREIIANRKMLKKKDGQTTAPIIIVEDLTKKNHALLCKAKENTAKYKNVWSKDGIILGKQHNDVIARINSFADIIGPPIERKHDRYSYASRASAGTFGSRRLHRGRGGRGRGSTRGFPSGGPRDVTATYFDRGLSLNNRFHGIHPDDLDLTDDPDLWK